MTIDIESARSTALQGTNEHNNPFVMWDNLAASATLGGTSVQPDGARLNAMSGTTYDYWMPTLGTGANLQADFGVDTSCTFAAIAAHNLGTIGAATLAAQIQHSPDASVWTDAGAGQVVPTTDDVIAWRFTAASKRYWRLRITSASASEQIAVGVFYLGNETILPTRTYRDIMPIIAPTEVMLQSNVSVGGNLMGASVISEGSTIAANLPHLPRSFVRGAEFTAFINAFNRGKPFFFAWRPADEPDDVHFCWREGDTIRPDNAGPSTRMGIKMAMRAYHG